MHKMKRVRSRAFFNGTGRADETLEIVAQGARFDAGAAGMLQPMKDYAEPSALRKMRK